MAHILNMVGQDSENTRARKPRNLYWNIVLWIGLSQNRRDIQIYTDGRTFNRMKGLQHGPPNIDFVNGLVIYSKTLGGII